MDSKKNKHIIGLDYFLTVYYNNEQNRFNRFATISDHKNQTKLLLHFNSERITKETMLERLFWDIAEFIESTDFIEDFCSDIKKQISDLPKKKNPRNSSKSSYTPPQNALKCPDKKNQSYNYQFASTYFDKGNFEFDTSSINLRDLRECLISYKREVYVLLKCRNYYFHNFYVNYYFKNGYLDILKKRIIELKLEFITLRFCRDKLTVKFKRSINEKINCYGFAINVLDDFIAIGIKELNNILAYYDISKEVFRENIRAENFTKYHLAKDIGCNIELERPELLKRLKLNQMNDNKESLANIGLEYHSHYIDYSRYDDYGYRIAEYEIECKYPNGVSYDELKRDLLVLEPDNRPKEQMTIDKYLKNGLLNDLKGFVMEYNKTHVHNIPAFSIEVNPVKNDFLLEYKSDYELHDFYSFGYITKCIKNRKIKNETS